MQINMNLSQIRLWGPHPPLPPSIFLQISPGPVRDPPHNENPLQRLAMKVQYQRELSNIFPVGEEKYT